MNRISLSPTPGKFFEYLDILIDGQSLGGLLEVEGLGVISPYGWPRGRELEAGAASRLLLAAPADLPDNRCSVLVRQVDADVNRGSIGVLVASTFDSFVWSTFAWETYRYSNCGERLDFDLESYRHVGPFTFARKEYETVFGSYVESAMARAQPDGRYFRFSNLTDWAKNLADRGNYKQAAVFAQELLGLAAGYGDEWNYGNAIHHGHLILGRVALAAGDTEAARSELLLAGRTPGSPQLNSFGPSMKLAKELFVAGEVGPICEYLELCRAFWKTGAQRLDTWKADLVAGRTPEFGANLAY